MTHALPTNQHNSDLIRSRFWNHLPCLSISLKDLWFARRLLMTWQPNPKKCVLWSLRWEPDSRSARAGQECYTSIMTSLCYMDLYGDFSRSTSHCHGIWVVSWFWDTPKSTHLISVVRGFYGVRGACRCFWYTDIICKKYGSGKHASSGTTEAHKSGMPSPLQQVL